ncbi:MAG: quinoprotein dehydrogenase-associated SoxYZ-like carrier [Filomicrobium sp.]
MRLEKSIAAGLLGAAVLGLSSVAAQAGGSWDWLKPEVFGERAILDGRGIIEFEAPNRPEDQSHVPVSIKTKLNDGRTIKTVYFIVDENPSPVAAKFEMGEGRSEVALSALFRFNAATDTRAVVEASDGSLYMVSKHTKFAGGQASCSAPPQGDPKEIAANMGKMTLENVGAVSTTMTVLRPKMKLTLSHPNHTGMVLDQITLFYIPLKMVSEVEVRQGDDLVYKMTGSITLSQDPTVNFDYRINGATEMKVTARDSDGSTWTKTFPIGQGS